MFVRTFKDLGIGGPIPPVGILYLSSFLKKKIKNINIIFSDYYFDGKKGFINKLKNFNPDIIGFSTMNCEKDLLLELIQIKKSLNKESIVIVGGPYATFNYREVIRIDGVDFCVVGEGEVVLANLIISLKTKSFLNIPNLVTKKNVDNFNRDFNFYIQNLDNLPFPDWDLIDFKKYSKLNTWNGIKRKKLYSPIVTSRGCPYNCTFCHNILGKKFRSRSVMNVLQEITYLHEKYRIEEFHIIDDVFNYDYERAKEIFLKVYNRYGKKLSFSFPNGIRADIFDENLASIMSRAGVYKIYFGVESAVNRVRNNLIKKNIPIEKINRAVEICVKNKIIPCGYFVYGIGESEREFQENLNYLKNSKFLMAHFFKYTDFSKSSNDFFFNYGFNETTFRIIKSYSEFYLNPKRLILLLLNFPSLKALKNILVLFLRALFYKLIIILFSEFKKAN